MREENESSTTDFTLLGVTRQREQEYFFFILFLFIYPITVFGNMLIILAIHSDTRLHNPMYFFLANLSLVDIFFSSVTIPKMLANHLLGSKAISFGGCMAQMYFMIGLANTDSYILAAMAYDRAVAISRPLHYATIMSPQLCVLLVAGSWVIANANALPHTLLTARLSFCGNKDVANFYCDIIPLLQMSCSGYLLQCEDDVPWGGGLLCATAVHHHLLRPGLFHSLAGSIYQGLPEGLVHLWLSPDSGVLVLWDSHGHVFQAPDQLQSEAHTDNCDVHSSDPNAEHSSTD